MTEDEKRARRWEFVWWVYAVPKGEKQAELIRCESRDAASWQTYLYQQEDGYERVRMSSVDGTEYSAVISLPKGIGCKFIRQAGTSEVWKPVPEPQYDLEWDTRHAWKQP